MTTTTFEDEVRAMLARRAADIPDRAGAAADVPLPSGLRIPLDEAPGRQPRRAPWLAVAAAVAVLAGVAGLVVAAGTDRSTERTRAADGPAAPASVPDRPPYLSSLPGGVSPTVGPVLPVGPLAATPEEAMAAVLTPVFGEAVTQPMPFATDESAPGEDGTWASWYGPTGPLDPAVWTVVQGSDAGTGGSVTARRVDGGWRAVAVTSDAIDLTGVGHDGDRLTGEVRVEVPAPVRVVVESLGGEALGSSDLTTHAESGGDASVLRLDDLGLHPGGLPAVLRVEVGDRPGQVGLDGVGVAAYAAVAVTPAAGPSAVPTTTTEVPEPPPASVASGRALEPGDGVLWRAPVALWGPSRADAALAFARQVLGMGSVDASGSADVPDTEPGDVILHPDPGFDVPIRLVRDGDTWTVLQVGRGSIAVDRTGDGIGYDVPDPGYPIDEEALVIIRADGTWDRYEGERPTSGLRPAAGWIITFVDAEGRIVGAVGNPA